MIKGCIPSLTYCCLSNRHENITRRKDTTIPSPGNKKFIRKYNDSYKIHGRKNIRTNCNKPARKKMILVITNAVKYLHQQSHYGMEGGDVWEKWNPV